MVRPPSICIFAPSGLTMMPMSCAQTIRSTRHLAAGARRPPPRPSSPRSFRRRCCRRCRSRGRSAPRRPSSRRPRPPPAARRRMRGSLRCLSRNASGSTPAAAAMMSICDSVANTFMLAPGARHGPTRERMQSCDAGPRRRRTCAPAGADPQRSGCRRRAPRRARRRRRRCSPTARSCRPGSRPESICHDRGRIEGVEEELLGAGPRDLYRPAADLGQPRRFDRLRGRRSCRRSRRRQMA